jgi:acyl carrier protein
MPQQRTTASIRSYIAEHFPAFRKKELHNTELLLQSGIIDSMGILDLVGHIETEFGISVADDDLVPENFGSIEAIATFVENKQGSDAESQARG